MYACPTCKAMSVSFWRKWLSYPTLPAYCGACGNYSHAQRLVQRGIGAHQQARGVFPGAGPPAVDRHLGQHRARRQPGLQAARSDGPVRQQHRQRQQQRPAQTQRIAAMATQVQRYAERDDGHDAWIHANADVAGGRLQSDPRRRQHRRQPQRLTACEAVRWSRLTSGLLFAVDTGASFRPEPGERLPMGGRPLGVAHHPTTRQQQRQRHALHQRQRDVCDFGGRQLRRYRSGRVNARWRWKQHARRPAGARAALPSQ